MRGFYKEVIQTVALAVFLVLVIHSAVQNYRVDGPSMEPGLHTGDQVAVTKLETIKISAEHVASIIPFVHASAGEYWHPFGELNYGDVVVFKYPLNPTENFVKRLIGKPGDTITITGGTVYRNGVALNEPYVAELFRQGVPTHVVPAGEYYMLGDNRAQSSDSREWGDVPEDDLIGKVMFTYWPFHRISVLSSLVSAF